MAQAKDLAAMRMRLLRRGYDRVTVDTQVAGSILIVAYEPLCGQEVRLRIKPDEVRLIGRW